MKFMRKKKTEARVPTLRSAIVSYVIAQGEKENMAENLPHFRRFLKENGISEVPAERLSRLVETEVRNLESAEKNAGKLARLFSRDGVVRKDKYRHGSAFCSSCGMFKDYRKECPFCGKIEITI